MTVTGSFTREAVPFRIHTADGRTAELEYSSPRPAALHDECQVLETLPWFEPGKPLRKYMLHDTELPDVEVIQLDFSESHKFAVAGLLARRSSWSATSRTRRAR
jgi:hypothetical protein